MAGIGLLGMIILGALGAIIGVTVWLLIIRALLEVPFIRHLAQNIMLILMDDR